MFTLNEGIVMTRGRRNINVKQQIMKALEKGPLTWSELLTKCGVSKGALSKHLKKLIKLKYVLTKTRNDRPPVTEYYLQKQEVLDIFHYTLRNLPERQAEFFVTNIVKPNIEKILSESRAKMYDNYFTAVVTSFCDKPIKVEKIVKPINRKVLVKKDPEEYLTKILESIEKFIPDSSVYDDTRLQDYINKESSDITIQLILFVYEIEKYILNSLSISKEFQEELRERGNLEGFVVISSVQKYGAWKEFDYFSDWWTENITPKVSNTLFLRFLAIDTVQKNQIWKK